MTLGRNDPADVVVVGNTNAVCLQIRKGSDPQIDSHASYVNHYWQVIVAKTKSAVENDRTRLSRNGQISGAIRDSMRL